MTSDFMTPPHSIEAEQSVLGGLLLDDDNSERTQKVLSISSQNRSTRALIRSFLLKCARCTATISLSIC